jgi:hypothetical protein
VNREWKGRRLAAEVCVLTLGTSGDDGQTVGLAPDCRNPERYSDPFAAFADLSCLEGRARLSALNALTRFGKFPSLIRDKKSKRRLRFDLFLGVAVDVRITHNRVRYVEWSWVVFEHFRFFWNRAGWRWSRGAAAH